MQAGTYIGHFELLQVVGRGGMGEVWRARDTRLERDVALKTLPPALAADADRVARLVREARLLATLNHTNIAAIHGLEEHGGQHWLVMELVEGPTLEDRLLSGPLPLNEAATIALQVAAALEAAHSRGIVHCDLKPSNIKLAPDDRVKVLDFGIARSLQVPGHTTQTTVTAPTAAAEVNGTPGYMGPEQLRGDRAGPVFDIWAFGVVFYRMLAGRLPFAGATAVDTAAEVLQKPPDLSALDAQLPDALLLLIRRCLEKDPRQRIQHAGDLRILIEEAVAAPAPPVRTQRTRRWPAISALAAVAFSGLALGAWLVTGVESENESPIRMELSFERSVGVPTPNGRRNVAISHDGDRIALASGAALLIRSLDAQRPIAVDVECANPFFSPDGAWVGCFNERLGLLKIPAAGGSPVRIAPVSERPAGATWASDGSIFFATSEGLFRVNEMGGERVLIARPDAARRERLYAWPQLLPRERALLLTVLSSDEETPPSIVRLDLTTGAVSLVQDGGSSAQYVAGGYLLYSTGTGLRATRFDERTGAVRGEAVSVTEAQIEVAGDNGAASYAVSGNGTLVTLAPQGSGSGGRELYWRDADGVETMIDVPPGDYAYPRISPDGRRVALNVRSHDNRDIWILDLERASLARITTDVAEDVLPRWSRDGRRILFSSNRGGNFDIHSQAADGSGAARSELAAAGPQMMLDLTADGQMVIALEDFRRLSVIEPATGSLTPLLHEGATYWVASISPDGRWIAYESNESGNQVEIFLRPFPDVAARREKVSVAGGRFPVWGPPDSHALYFVQTDGAMMRAHIRLSPDLQLGQVTRMFDWIPPVPQIGGAPYDVSPVDGRFLLLGQAEKPGPYVKVEVVLNWFTDLQRLFDE